VKDVVRVNRVKMTWGRPVGSVLRDALIITARLNRKGENLEKGMWEFMWGAPVQNRAVLGSRSGGGEWVKKKLGLREKKKMKCVLKLRMGSFRLVQHHARPELRVLMTT